MENNDVCCPVFSPEPWDDKIIEWKEKYFIKEKSLTLFYMPVNFSGTMKKLFAQAEKAGACNADAIYLSEHTSKWNMNIWLSMDKEVPGAVTETLTGSFYCKVYEGSFSETGKWEQDFSSLAKSKGYSFIRRFSWYTTCPKCARKYGKNYVVLIGQLTKG